MFYLLSSAVFVLALQVGAGGDELVLTECLVKAERDVRIASEEGGVLFEVPVREGDHVTKGQTLAQVDDRQAKAALHVAEIALAAAEKRAKDTIQERYATKAMEVAYVAWQQDLHANKEQPGAVSDIEVRRHKLEYEKARLQIEQAQNDQVLAGMDSETKKAERDAQQTNLERLTIAAPFDGQVVTVYRDRSEWVSPGDPVMRLIRFDRMHVEGFVLASDYDPTDLLGKPVTVEVGLARGRTTEFPGKIIHCGQIVDDSGTYLVRAEVENKRVGEVWVIRPGLETSMTVHIGRAANPVGN